MNSNPPEFLPAARLTQIITKEIDGELLVYDQTRDKAHCLNESAAAIWKRCDGRTTAGEIAKSLASEYAKPIDVSVVWLGLDELRRKDLLAHSQHWSQTPTGRSVFSRREAIRRIGLVAAIALPAVVTIAAPTPAQAGTCRHANSSCTTGGQCCSGVCTGSPLKCLGG
ncbi:MAG TPA: PqqD family protein [Pyrinomonadaceae bacterium]|jgi:hypothetical protein|nr:PqqD family protein [Pyrinomonadaceae bacterium]